MCRSLVRFQDLKTALRDAGTSILAPGFCRPSQHRRRHDHDAWCMTSDCKQHYTRAAVNMPGEGFHLWARTMSYGELVWAASSANTDTFQATMSCTELQSAAVITSLRFNPDTRIRDLIIGQPGLLTRYADDDSTVMMMADTFHKGGRICPNVLIYWIFLLMGAVKL